MLEVSGEKKGKRCLTESPSYPKNLNICNITAKKSHIHLYLFSYM